VAFSPSVMLRGGMGLVFRVGGGVHYFQKQLKMEAHFFMMGNGDAIFTFAIFFLDKNYPNN